MTTPEDAIRARRRLTNKLIAVHDAARLAPFFAADARLIGGEGGLLLGRDAILKAFAVQFADPTFGDYVRTPETVEMRCESTVSAYSLTSESFIEGETSAR